VVTRKIQSTRFSRRCSPVSSPSFFCPLAAAQDWPDSLAFPAVSIQARIRRCYPINAYPVCNDLPRRISPIGSVHRRLYFLFLKQLGVDPWEKKSGSIQRIATAAVFNWNMIMGVQKSEHTNPCSYSCLTGDQCLTSRLNRQQQRPWPEDLDEVSVLLLCSAT
jgi:hypothetical protein